MFDFCWEIIVENSKETINIVASMIVTGGGGKDKILAFTGRLITGLNGVDCAAIIQPTLRRSLIMVVFFVRRKRNWSFQCVRIQTVDCDDASLR